MPRPSRTRSQEETRPRASAAPAVVFERDRVLAGRMAGLLYLTGAASAIILLLLPGATIQHPGIVLGVVAPSVVWGIVALRLDWRTLPAWVSHASSSSGFLVAATVTAATGGATSPARFFLLFIAVYAAFFYSPRLAAVYVAGCALLHALPLLYDGGSVDNGFLRELAVFIPTYAVLAFAIAAGAVRLGRMRDQAERMGAAQVRLAHEQRALRRVATAVAAAREAEDVYTVAAEQLAELVGADGAGILRYEPDGDVVVEGSWAEQAAGQHQPGTVIPARSDSEMEAVRRTGRPVRIDRYPAGSEADALGYATSVLAPIVVSDEVWGALVVASARPSGFEPGTEGRLVAFAELLAMAVVNTESRQALAAQASTDPLTGLVNHRRFQERLAEEASRAGRHGRDLSIALLDVDHFKQINDTAGHAAGDEVLAGVADCLRAARRTEDVVARLGGDEFALLMPEADRHAALALAERARRNIAEADFGGHDLTVSIGICELSQAGSADELVRLADGALYWGKAHGRDVTWLYDPEVVRELSAQERAEHLQRSQALTALRALARAIDAKDPTTRLHSERVAALAVRLGEAMGWAPDRLGLLSEAGLIHDVGKIGIHDAILLKPGRLDEAEYDAVKQHAPLGAEIAQEVLSLEQTEWIRWHHERADGRGYPDGRGEADIPEGAAILAIADAWDVMTISRPYGLPKPVPEALVECRELAGSQFTVAAVEALLALPDAALAPPEPPEPVEI